MYVYDQYDQQIVDDRVAQFRDQTQRYLAGDLSEEEFLPLRLQNGLYVQRYAPMLRVAIPYGMVSAKQMRMLAHVARKYDRGYGHFSTRQNLQYNWPTLESVPDILEELATVEMHAIQTSGNCIRNVTTDQFAGATADEIEDPRPWAELLRQWSTFHPEFAFLPRKFKIAVCATPGVDRAATQVHDVGVYIVENDAGEIGFKILAGGGQGRTPVIGSIIKEFLPKEHLLSYLDAVLRVYNRLGRRDNKYKARIKILVRALKPDVFSAMVEEEWAHLKDGPITITQDEMDRVKNAFTTPDHKDLPAENAEFEAKKSANPVFTNWVNRNVHTHKKSGYAIVTLTLKETGIAPGDATDEQMDRMADMAERYSFDEMRVSHNQNIILADVEQGDLYQLWEDAKKLGFATPNLGLLTDMICCPGGDFCSLANAKSLPIADQLQHRFDDLDYLYDIGELELNISGCMNACGHHHVGNIGILGVDKKGAEFYQVSLGGRSGVDASIGKIVGPSFGEADVADAVEKIINVYIENRTEEERFIDTYERIGMQPFKTQVYATNA
jgi:sulfite reductase (NADPH) hemoprotein beta-component